MTQRKHTPSYTAEFRTRGVRFFKENRADYASDNAAYRPHIWCQRTAPQLSHSCRSPTLQHFVGRNSGRMDKAD